MEVELDLSLNFLFGFLFPASHPYRRGGAHRDRSKSRDRFFKNSLELLPTVSPVGSGPPSPDVTICKDSLDDVSADVTQKFKYLGTHDHAQAAGLRRSSQRGASQEFSENGDPDDLFSRNRSDSSSSQASTCFSAAQTLEAVTMKTGKLSGHCKSEAPGIQHIPFFNSYIDGVTMKGTTSGILGNRATANGLGEKALPSNHQKSAAKPQDPQTMGRITNSGQDMAFPGGKYRGNTLWPSTSTHNAPNGSSQIMAETPTVSKSNATGLGLKAAVTGAQNLRSQVLSMFEETTAPVQASKLPQSPPPSSSHRVAASGTPGKNSAGVSGSPASEPSRMTPDSAECKSHRELPRQDKHNPMALSYLPKNCNHFIARSL